MVLTQLHRFMAISLGGIFIAYTLSFGGILHHFFDSSMNANTGQAMQMCTDGSADCATPIAQSVECASFCLNAAAPADSARILLIVASVLFAAAIGFVAFQSATQAIEQLRQFWHVPQYIFRTVVLRV